MARFPKVQSPCPYKADLAAHMTGDVCRMCDRKVHDLGAMSDQQREQFLASCGEEVCVSYSVPVRVALGAALIATSLHTGSIAASDVAAPVDADASQGSAEFAAPAGTREMLAAPQLQSLSDCESMQMIIVGGIKKMSEAEYIDTSADLELPELPVIYETRR